MGVTKKGKRKQGIACRERTVVICSRGGKDVDLGGKRKKTKKRKGRRTFFPRGKSLRVVNEQGFF